MEPRATLYTTKATILTSLWLAIPHGYHQDVGKYSSNTQ